MVNTRFWIDEYISNLDPIEKLLFLYFLTNQATDICGIYELPLKNVANDTGIDEKVVRRIIKRFTRDKRIYYVKGWVAIHNFILHQSLNPSVVQGIVIGLNKAPKEVVDVLGKQWVVQAVDRLSPAWGQGSGNLNLNLNSNLNIIYAEAASAKKGSKKTPNAPEIAKISPIKSKREAKKLVWEDYLKQMSTDPRLHIQLIGYFFKRRGIRFDTDLEAESAIKMHLRAASEVSKFGRDKVFKAMDECDHMNKKDGIKWTLNTVLKQLTK